MSLKCLSFEARKENCQATEDRHTSVLNVARTTFIMCKMSLHASRGVYLIQILKLKIIETTAEFLKNLEVPPSCRNQLRFFLCMYFYPVEKFMGGHTLYFVKHKSGHKNNKLGLEMDHDDLLSKVSTISAC